MGDATFQLRQKPDMATAERLAQRLDAEPGVTSAVVDPNLARVYVTFDARKTGDLHLQQVIEQEGQAIAESDETLDFSSHAPGYTEIAREQEGEQEAATRLAFEAERYPLPGEEPGG